MDGTFPERLSQGGELDRDAIGKRWEIHVAFTLQALNGANSGKKVELQKDKIRLGRHPDCEVVVDLNAVSRFHAHLLLEAGGYYIEDLQSRNGTFVNGNKIEGKQLLADNDRVKICDMLFVYRTGEGSVGATIPKVLMPQQVEEADEKTSTVINTLTAHQSADMTVKVQPEAKLKAIIEISQALGQTLDLDALANRILDSLFNIFPAADRGLLVLQDDNGTLIPTTVKHRRGGEDTVRFSRTIAQKAMDEKLAILSADASSDERFNMSQSIADFRLRSVMCAPLVTQNGGSLGIIQIDNQSHNKRFDMDDLQILQSVANMSAIFIENATMHQDSLQQERIQRELNFAKEVQTGFLPHSMPDVPGYSFWAFYEAAGQVGGDYYDFQTLPNKKLAAILGDVSGKGVPAALMMAKVSSDTKVALLTSPDPVSAMQRINDAVCAAALEDKFITMALCLIDQSLQRMAIVNAGHMSPIIRRANGTLDEPADEKVSGLPLGVMEGYEYEVVETHINAGDLVVIYSDGVNEAMNAENDAYGTDRLRALIQSLDLPPNQMGPRLIKDVREHVAGHKQSDDITMVVFARTAL